MCAVGTIKSRVNWARVKLAAHIGVDGAAAFAPGVATGSTEGKG